MRQKMKISAKQFMGYGRTAVMVLCFIYLLGVQLEGQIRKDPAVHSWKTGKGSIKQKDIVIDFDDTREEFNMDFPDESGKKIYRLRARKVFVSTLRVPSIQCVSVVLNELHRNPRGGDFLDWNLLGEEAGDGGDVLGNFANFLCPIEKPHKVLDRGHFPVYQPRQFLIKGFVAEFIVKEYSYDAQSNRLKKLILAVSLRNTIKK
jgi:hypothetical protein